MINKVVLVGRLTKDITLGKTSNGKTVTAFTVACRRDADNTDFVPCRAYTKTAELLGQYCGKGSMVGITGSVHTYTTERNGIKNYVTEILTDSVAFLDSRSGNENRQTAIEEEPVLQIDSDDLPF